MSLRIFRANHIQDRFPCLRAPISWLHDYSLLPLSNTPHCRTELPLENQYVERLSPVLLRLIPLGFCELLIARASGLLYQNMMLSGLPIVEVFPYLPLDCVVVGNVESVLQYDHCSACTPAPP